MRKMKVGVGDYLFLFAISLTGLSLGVPEWWQRVTLGLLAILLVVLALWFAYKLREYDAVFISVERPRRRR